MIRVQSAVTECLDLIQIDEILQIVIIPDLNLLNLVGSTESIEEVDERKSAVNCSAVCNGSQIHDLLYRALAEHCGTGLATCIDIRVITEDVQSVGGNAAGRDVEHCRQALTCDLVDVRDHQKKSLRSGECRCHGTGYDGAVCGTCGTCLRLHLRDLYGLTEDVLASGSGPLINVLRHD